MEIQFLAQKFGVPIAVINLKGRNSLTLAILTPRCFLQVGWGLDLLEIWLL